MKKTDLAYIAGIVDGGGIDEIVMDGLDLPFDLLCSI